MGSSILILITETVEQPNPDPGPGMVVPGPGPVPLPIIIIPPVPSRRNVLIKWLCRYQTWLYNFSASTKYSNDVYFAALFLSGAGVGAAVGVGVVAALLTLQWI